MRSMIAVEIGLRKLKQSIGEVKYSGDLCILA